ncbi:hypothetical protein HII36_29830 [Nonomuraea sp. NN258]|uniref:hypothetical protein n=1 Tax=Nonomuraea antri TaxID=2730852 RepID=UPI00156828CE|nr:hypothetical protein [Nonomuraea antri]NRQ36001.1 hypothetical protein [Nonomuraea antri]
MSDERAEVQAARIQLNAMLSAMRSSGLIEPEPAPDVQVIGRQFGFEMLRRWWRHESPQPARCAHPRPVPVESVVTGELLARLCPDCDEQLPAEASWRDELDQIPFSWL